MVSVGCATGASQSALSLLRTQDAKGLGATNVIPDTVLVEGTFRTMNEEWRSAAHDFMKKNAVAIAKDMGGECEFRVEGGYPFLVNDHNATERARMASEEYLGKENVELLEKRMTAEDFAWIAQGMRVSGLSPVMFARWND